jgi:hypothetical protein
MPEPFDALGCDIARFQAAHVEGYARLCRARGVDLRAVVRVGDAPPVPTDAFKLTRVAAFDAHEAVVEFRTSGTTLGARGVHAMRDVATYDAAAVAFGRAWLARDLPARIPVVVLGPSAEEAQDSSLTHMCARFVEAFGLPAPAEATYVLSGGIIDLSVFDERVTVAIATST